jgi:hypothetical protein
MHEKHKNPNLLGQDPGSRRRTILDLKRVSCKLSQKGGIDMKRGLRTFGCGEGGALLATWWKKGDEFVMDFSCVESSKEGNPKGNGCVPKGGSKYIFCATHECPEGYVPWVSILEDRVSGKAGAGFHCVEAQRTGERRSLWDKLFPHWDSVPG